MGGVGIQEKTRLFGVLGDPVDHSLSPAMHDAAFAARRLPHVYLRFRVSPTSLPRALDEARQLGMGGLNLTVPLKEAALPLVNDLTPAADRAGAVNTILFRGTRLVGHNTDGDGFVRSLRGRVRLRGARVVLIGAGGSARAVGSSLARAGCAHLTLINRTRARAEALADRLGALGAMSVSVLPLDRDGDAALCTAQVVVNTTSTGLAGGRLPIRAAAAPSSCLFIDLTYGVTPTPFLRDARRHRRPVLDGAPMLLHQGALAFEAWTGTRAPLAAMERGLGSALRALPHGTRARRSTS